jgi:hypothetical protein
MSSAEQLTPRTAGAVDDGWRVTHWGVMRSEWTKLWSLRSTPLVLLLAFVVLAVWGPIASASKMSSWSPSDLNGFSAVDESLGGFHLAELVIGALGVLVVTGEYTTGRIRSTFMAVPRRLPVLWAKAATLTLVTFTVMLVAALIAFFVSQQVLTQHHVQTMIGHAPALRALIGCGLYLAAVGLFGMALGLLVRSTAGGITLYIALLFVVRALVATLPQGVQNTVNPYLLSNAGTVVLTDIREPHTFAPWTGFGVYCAYTAVLLAVGSILLVRRDT